MLLFLRDITQICFVRIITIIESRVNNNYKLTGITLHISIITISYILLSVNSTAAESSEAVATWVGEPTVDDVGTSVESIVNFNKSGGGDCGELTYIDRASDTFNFTFLLKPVIIFNYKKTQIITINIIY